MTMQSDPQVEVPRSTPVASGARLECQASSRGSACSQKARGLLLEDGEAEAVSGGHGLARFWDDARGSGKQQGKESGDLTTKGINGSQESACS